MLNSRYFAHSVLLFACGWFSASCGATTTDEDIGGSTHWLLACQKDSECETGLCYAGVCTTSCVRSEQCDAESSGQCVSGVALPPESSGVSCRTDASVCLLPCDFTASCGAGLTCSDGYCVGKSAGCDSVGSVSQSGGEDASVSSSGGDASLLQSPSSSNSVESIDTALAEGSATAPAETETALPDVEGSETAPAATETATAGPEVEASATAPGATQTASVTPVLSQSPRSLNPDSAVYAAFISVYAPEGYCDSNTVEGLSSTLTISDADNNRYKLILAPGEQDCGANETCVPGGTPSGNGSWLEPGFYQFSGFGLETEAQACSDSDAGVPLTCLPRHELPWGVYTVEFCAYLGDLEFPDGTRDILCGRTSSEPVCVSAAFQYTSDGGAYLTLPEAP